MLPRTRLGLLAGRDLARPGKNRPGLLPLYYIKKCSKYKFLAGIRWLGVRIGGVGWLPFKKWRWGYGWNYPRTKAPDPDNSTETVEKNKAEFDKKLKEAQQEKAKAHTV